MAEQGRMLSDQELQSLFDNPKADLSLLSGEEHARLLQLTDPKTAAAPPSALTRFAVGAGLPSTTPSDYWEGPAYAVRHPIDSASLLIDAVKKDPVGAIPVVGQLRNAGRDVVDGNYAGAAGNLAALAAPLALKGVRAPVGVGVDAVGRGVESAMTSSAAQHMGGIGALYKLMQGHPWEAAGYAAAPPVGAATGRGLQVIGRTLSGTPNPAGQIDAILQRITAPGGPTVNPWESTFLTSVESQAQAGPLSPAQKTIVNRLYRRTK